MFMNALLSDDRPRSRSLGALVLAMLALLLVYPFVFPGATALNSATMICLLALTAASYDMLLGYTAIISFAHATFYGIGAYSVALILKEHGNGWGVTLLALMIGPAIAAAFSLLVGLLSLRVKALFFALVTLAIGAGFGSLLMTQYHITGGEDGLLFRVPDQLRVSYQFMDGRLAGFDLVGWVGSWFSADSSALSEWTFSRAASGKILGYYGILGVAIALFLLMLRFMNSPFGRVLQAIRENEFRVRAIGYKPVIYRTVVFCLASAIAAFAGGLGALWTGYVNPEVAGFNAMVNILIVVVIGGVASMYGAWLGAALLIVAQDYLRALVNSVFGSGLDLSLPFFGNFFGELLHPNRWVMWMGLIFVLSVYFFSHGIAGTLRARAAVARERAREVAAA